MLARQVWDYWLPTAHVQQRNITEGLKGLPLQTPPFAAFEPLPRLVWVVLQVAQINSLLHARDGTCV